MKTYRPTVVLSGSFSNLGYKRIISTPYHGRIWSSFILFRFGANVLKECRFEVAAFTAANE
jgi:hypothetical protein